MILYYYRRDSGFVGIQDLGTNCDIKGHADNSDGIISIPSRRQSRIFSMDLSFLGTEEDHDRIVNNTNRYVTVALLKIFAFRNPMFS